MNYLSSKNKIITENDYFNIFFDFSISNRDFSYFTNKSLYNIVGCKKKLIFHSENDSIINFIETSDNKIVFTLSDNGNLMIISPLEENVISSIKLIDYEDFCGNVKNYNRYTIIYYNNADWLGTTALIFNIDLKKYFFINLYHENIYIDEINDTLIINKYEDVSDLTKESYIGSIQLNELFEENNKVYSVKDILSIKNCIMSNNEIYEYAYEVINVVNDNIIFSRKHGELKEIFTYSISSKLTKKIFNAESLNTTIKSTNYKNKLILFYNYNNGINTFCNNIYSEIYKCSENEHIEDYYSSNNYIIIKINRDNKYIFKVYDIKNDNTIDIDKYYYESIYTNLVNIKNETFLLLEQNEECITTLTELNL